MLIGTIILFAVIMGTGCLGVYASWLDFNKPKGVSFYSHIRQKDCVKLFVYLFIICVLTCLFLLIWENKRC